jgi:RHS repeat-associated protein
MHRSTLLAMTFAFLGALSGSAHATDGLTYYFPDQLGSPVAASNSAAEILWSRSYRPFGEMLEQCYSGCLQNDSRGYTAHEYDSNTALVYMLARHYDPVVGRFLSVDPATPSPDTPASNNRYAYAWNNPYRYTDPNGEDPYLVSRELSFLVGFSHNFVVTNADYPGDPAGIVYSFGRLNSGMTGRVTLETKGLSAGTSDTDRTFWLGLANDAEVAARYSLKVGATDATVDQYALGLIPDSRYSPTTLIPGTTNSNSAASAVINNAVGEEVEVPDGYRFSPGADDWRLLNFDLQPAR